MDAGTVTISVKPILDEAALLAITNAIASAVKLGVERGMA